MSIDVKIATLEAELAALKNQREVGYWVGTNSQEEYYISDMHEVIYDNDNEIAAIIVNVALVEQYFKDNK